MSGSTFYIGNTTLLIVDGLADTTGAYLDDATVTLESLVDDRSVPVPRFTVPVALAYVEGSSGRYQTTLPHTLALLKDKGYLATIRAESDAGAVMTVRERIVARTREA